MRDHLQQPDSRVDLAKRPRAVHERADGNAVGATMGLQRLAGNEAVTELLTGFRGAPPSGSPAVVSAVGRLPASPAAPTSPAVAVQREPCVDCPDAVLRLASPSPETTTEPTEQEQ